MLRITTLRCPVIAQVHGIATAAGCQLVATCDLAIAADTARFATPGVNIGLFCSTPMVALTRAVGRKAAMGMLLTGEMVDAAEAQRLGLINRVVPEADLAGRHGRSRRQIAAKSRLTVAIGKQRLLPTGRDGPGRRLRLRLRRHGPQHGGGGRGGGDRRLPGQTSAGLDRRLDIPVRRG